MEIAYYGFKFHGWQIQLNAITIQGEIEKALSTIFKKNIKIFGSSRTDTGVNALKQVAHLDLPSTIDLQKLQNSLNSILPNSISIKRFFRVKSDAHSRFDAFLRTYEYHIYNSKNPFYHQRAMFFIKPLDLDIMNKGSAILKFHTNYKSFSKVKTSVPNFICKIREAKWEVKYEKLVFTISSNRFLRGMVRTIVGTMIDLGTHKINLKEFEDIIVLKNRKCAGMSVVPYGLYLTEVKYPISILY